MASIPELEPMGEIEVLENLLEWSSDPEAKDKVPGKSEQERARFRCRVRRGARRMISQFNDSISRHRAIMYLANVERQGLDARRKACAERAEKKNT